MPRNVLKSRKVLAPDNVQCCEYYKNLNDKTDEELVWYYIGDAHTDKIMQGRLLYVLIVREQELNGRPGKVLELMAGPGRNYPALKNYFNEVRCWSRRRGSPN